MTLTDEQIREARATWPCCALDSAYDYVQAEIHGDRCADKFYRKAVLLSWGSAIMCDTNVSGQTSGCVDPEFAWAVYQKVSCECNYSECRTPAVPDCTIVPDYTVINAIAFSDLPLSPSDGDSYYILSGTNAGAIATWTDDPGGFSNGFSNGFDT